MAAMLRRLPALAGLAVLAGTGAALAGHRAFTRMVGRDVQALRARAAPGRAGVVTEEMLADLPEPVRRYLRYTGVVGRPFPGTIQLRQEGQLTGFVAKRYRTADASSPETWSTPVTGYGEFEGLRLPARGKAIYKLPGGDLEYIDVTITDLHYDIGAAAPEGRA